MKDNQRNQIIRHGKALLGIFPNCSEKDPVKLCKRLRRLENRAHRLATDLCNGHCTQDRWEKEKEAIKASLSRILGKHDVPIFINGDARGYALKIESDWIHENSKYPAPTGPTCNWDESDWDAYEPPANRIRRDWGGYGLIAPEITGD